MEPGSGPSGVLVLLGLVVTAGIIGGEIYLLRTCMSDLTIKGWAVAVTLTVGYVFAGGVLRPNPDTSDLGWFGGAVDNPFSFSDDRNRFLLGLQIVLLPGRLMSWSIVSAVRTVLR